MKKKPAKDKIGSYIVQLGSTYLTIHRPKNSQWSKAHQQKLSNQLYQMEQNKKLFDQICRSQQPLVIPKSGISEDPIHRILSGGKVTEAAWMFLTIYMLNRQVHAFQPPKISNHQLFGGTSQYTKRPDQFSSQSHSFNKKTNLEMTRSSMYESLKTIEMFDDKMIDTSNILLDNLL